MPETAQHRRLLVVEDLGLVGQLTPALTRAGWTVHSCTSAREAIYVAKQREVDGLLITATLPDERGDVVFYRLAAMHPHLRTRTVFLTRADQEQDFVDTTERTSLRVPVTPDQVVHTVSAFFSAPTPA